MIARVDEPGRACLRTRRRGTVPQRIAHAEYMAESRNAEWLSRLQSKGPNLVSLALAALIAVELARIAVALIGGPVKSPQPASSVGNQPPPHAGANVLAVASAHLFGAYVADPATQDPNNAPLSSANLVLAGTIATDDPKHGIAIISDGGPSKVYSVGENVNGASLYSVYLDHVILDRGGNLETLLLPRQLAGAGGPGAAARRGTADRRTAAAVDNIRRLVQQDPGILDQVMRTVPSYDNAAGRLRGFRAYPGRNRAIFNKLGLKPGDLVTAINGQPLDDPQHSQEVFNTIQSSTTATVTIERGGAKQDITLNIAQVATDASHDLESDAPGAGPNAAAPNMPPPAAPGANPQQPPPNETTNE
jgi:general secretion pathway protein C